MLVIGQVSPPTVDDDEAAAIAAAVTAFIESEKTPASVTVAASTRSGWKIAGILEGTGRSKKVTSPLHAEVRKKAWAATKLPSLFSIIAPLAFCLQLALCAQSGHAQDGTVPPVAPDVVHNNGGGMPPRVAPSLSKTNAKSLRASDGLQPTWQYSEPRPPALLRPPLPAPGQIAGESSDSAPDNNIDPRENQQSASAPEQPPQLPFGTVRVALQLDTSTAAIGLPDGATLRDARNGMILAELPPQSHWHLATKSPGGFSQLCFSGKINNVSRSQVLVASRNPYKHVAFISGAVPTSANLVALPASRSPEFFLSMLRAADGTTTPRAYVLVPPSDGAFAVAGKLYRGSLLIKPCSPASSTLTNVNPQPIPSSRQGSGVTPRLNSFNLINCVDVEDYLLSVVPSEMPSGWPLEALKAQAITARSYAIASIGKHEAEGYDLKATTEDQVYSGVAGESQNSNRAVAETSGQLLKYHGNVITAYFHSASGGSTELSDNVWSRSVPYLRAVPDYDDDSPHFSWTRSFNPDAAQQALEKNGKGVGTLLAVLPVARGVSPRVRWLMISGTDKTLFMSGEQARKIFSLPSTLFNVGTQDGSYVFAGRGFGHGLGMSQWGAKKLADAGYTASQILSYYYKDITIER